jgi:Outer membrane protein beta-barrel domain
MRILVCLALGCCLSAGADAQTLEKRGAVGVVVGGGRTWDDEGGLGAGRLVGGRIDWRLFGSTHVEVSFDSLRHLRTGGFFEAEGRTFFVGGSLVKRFGAAAVQPYVLGGYHLARHAGSTTFDGMPRNEDSTGHGYHVGGGIAVRFRERFDLGPEVRFYMIQPKDDSDPAMAYWIGARFGFRL